MTDKQKELSPVPISIRDRIGRVLVTRANGVEWSAFQNDFRNQAHYELIGFQLDDQASVIPQTMASASLELLWTQGMMPINPDPQAWEALDP